jgi:WD40 repeat protein
MTLAYSADSKTLACGGSPGSLVLWDLAKTKAKPLIGHKSPKRVLQAAFSPDGKTLVSGDDDGVLKFWEVKSGKDIGLPCNNRAPVYALAFSPDGKTVATSVANGVNLWEAGTGKKLSTFADQGILYGLAWSPDSKMVATGGSSNVVKLWDAETGKEKAAFMGHEEVVRSVAFSPTAS